MMSAMKQGRMLLAYSGGLHHVQVPGHIPNVFKTVRMRLEAIDIADYMADINKRGGPDDFKRNVKADLERRRDFFCPEEGKITSAVA